MISLIRLLFSFRKRDLDIAVRVQIIIKSHITYEIVDPRWTGIRVLLIDGIISWTAIEKIITFAA